MKKLFTFFVLLAICATAVAQNPSYQQKLYYTCKIWGYVKYFHSNVSICKVNWDSVLVSTLPIIKTAATGDDFNNALNQMLLAAGPMKIATKPLPDTLPAELKFNRNLGWFNDTILRSDVKTILDTIKNNFRPHSMCWVNDDGSSGYGWLAFPHDDPIINSSLSTNYPDESTRLMIIFRYWNILNYFNPYNNILDTPWDSTLYNNILAIANAPTYTDFFRKFKKMTAALDDAHVEGLTNSFLAYYSPKLVLRYSLGDYIVVKSGYPEIAVGDIIESIDNKTTAQWEDSLRAFTSAGNPSVFRRFMSSNILRGAQGAVAKISYKDSLGNSKSLSVTRDDLYGNWFSYYPNEELAGTKWKKWNCNVGYVHMGNLLSSEVTAMYNDLKNTKAIIFDIRNYPNATAWPLSTLMYPNKASNAKFTQPDVRYPGTYTWSDSYMGNMGNSESYKGKVIVLCNQETQSQAEYTTMILQVMPNAVVVGSQTAGADGNITMFKISADVQTGFTSLGVFYPNGKETQRIGIVPDSVVYPTAEGIRQGRDEVLEKALDIAGCVVSVDDLKISESNVTVYPNPFSDNTNIEFEIASSGNVVIKIFNQTGNHIKTINCENCQAGKNIIHWNCLAKDKQHVPNGIYYCEIHFADRMLVKKMIVVN